MLTADQRVRHARHRSLVELGDAGVLALLGATVSEQTSDTRVNATSDDYLRRAGVSIASERSSTIAVDVDRFAGSPELVEAAAACLGALVAVERIKSIAGVGVCAPIPDFVLADGASPAAPSETK